jgi:hypothetical protein
MGAGERLRDRDSRLLPPLLRALARLGRPTARPRLLVAAATALVVSAVLGALFLAADREDPAMPAAPSLTRVGVLEGQSVADYVQASRRELTALLGRSVGTLTATTALVSFTAYVAPQRLAPILPGVAVHQVYARAPLSGIQTQVLRIGVLRVPEDVVAGMRDAAARREQERIEFVRLGVALGPGHEDRRLHRAYDTAAQVAAAEADAYRAGCPCVFAAVVSAVPAALDRIAASPEVRAVDPAPEVRVLGEADFRPPLPEQRIGGIRPPGDPWASPSVTTAAPGVPSPTGEPSPTGVPSRRATSERDAVERATAEDTATVTSASPHAAGRPPVASGARSPERPGTPGEANGGTLSASAGASREAAGR